MLILSRKIYANNSGNKEWAAAQLRKQKENFITAYNANGQVIPGGGTPEYSWYKRKKKFADIRADLEAQGADLSRTALAVQRVRIWERFGDNYFARDRMPLRTSKEELADYEYWIGHQDDAEFLQYLKNRGVNMHRTQDVVKQEENYFNYLYFVASEKHLPRGQRHRCLDGNTAKVSELAEEQRREDVLSRWQYNVLSNNIQCLPYCRINIRKEIAKIVAHYAAEDLKARR
ncbi:hypothetical protein NO1_1528 [Candidatus Termititenax aidoneus]|uniref:Uncharacterized protein n=1 Tax=Termititenax aidoneus TaxID=2218524 RepID=A0A388TBY6_TERA1|nr:hypothetical protein NO1_1528 [Candidatus Termititenax aidoneus]